MNPDVPRETFTALRARREAYHVASDMIYEEPIDVRRVACSGCGRWLDVHGPTVTDPLICRACKARTPLPPYLRARYMPRQASAQVQVDHGPTALRVTWSFDDLRGDIPPWLIWFTVMLVVLLAGAIVCIFAT